MTDEEYDALFPGDLRDEGLYFKHIKLIETAAKAGSIRLEETYNEYTDHGRHVVIGRGVISSPDGSIRLIIGMFDGKIESAGVWSPEREKLTKSLPPGPPKLA